MRASTNLGASTRWTRKTKHQQRMHTIFWKQSKQVLDIKNTPTKTHTHTHTHTTHTHTHHTATTTVHSTVLVFSESYSTGVFRTAGTTSWDVASQGHHTLHPPSPSCWWPSSFPGQPRTVTRDVVHDEHEQQYRPTGTAPNSKHWFTTSFLQPLPYLVTL